MRSDVDERQLCEGCGDDRGLMEVDGLVLCRTCREDYYITHRKEYAEDFVMHTDLDKAIFLKDWFFGQLDREKQIDILLTAFKEMKGGMNHDLAENMMQEYVQDQKDAYCDYLDEKLEAMEVRQ